MTCLGPLFAADFGDIVGIILVILFVLIPAIGQLFAKKAADKKLPAGGAAGKPPRKGPLEDEIGDFLRQAVQRRKAAGQPGRAGGPPHPPRGKPGHRRPEQPVMADIVGADIVEPPPAIAPDRPVGRGIESTRLPRQKVELAESVSRVAKEEARLEQHVHEKFDRQVSRFRDAAGAPPRPTAPHEQPRDSRAAVSTLPPTAAAGLAAMFADTQNLRQAILINEIIQRPEHRW